MSRPERIPPHVDGAGRRYVHLTIANKAGSVEHYYHFALGFLVPLLVSLEEIPEVARARRLYIRSCAVFDPLLKETGLPLTLLRRSRHKRLGSFLKKLPRWLPFRRFRIHGFDTAANYDAPRFRLAADILGARLRERIDTEANALARSATGEGPVVLLIDRKAPHPFYLSEKAERQGAGSTRRSIANIEEIEDGLREAGLNLRSESLEGRSLAYQIALFRGADVVIAQHGAALANMIWARPTTAFVEIVPQGDEITQRQDHFSELARLLGLPYRSVGQPGSHGPVDVALLTQAVRELVESGKGEAEIA